MEGGWGRHSPAFPEQRHGQEMSNKSRGKAVTLHTPDTPYTPDTHEAQNVDRRDSENVTQ